MKFKKQRLILVLLLLTSLTFHIVFGLENTRQVSVLESEVVLNEMNISSLERRNALYEEIIENQSSRLREYEQPDPEQDKQYIGEFEITYYTAGPESTGKTPDHPAYGITKSGTTVKEGQTIAADWTVLPAGTKVYIEGVGERIVEDTGGLIKGNSIDVYVEDVETALQGGRHMAEVWLLE